MPRAVERACQELLRRWKQLPEFGPVTLLYCDGPISQVDGRPTRDLVLRCESHPDNESALDRVVRLRKTLNLFMPLIVDGDEAAIWTGHELLRECDDRKKTRSAREFNRGVIESRCRIVIVFRSLSSSAENQIAQPCELIETCKLAIHEIERLLSVMPREVSVTGLLLVD